MRDWLAKVRIDTHGCWLWTGSQDGHGYGSAYVHEHKEKRNVYRMMFEWVYGPVPEGYTLDHLCRVKLCCNPAHLEVVTKAVNIARAGLAHQAETPTCRKCGASDWMLNGVGSQGQPRRRCRNCHRINTGRNNRRYREDARANLRVIGE